MQDEQLLPGPIHQGQVACNEGVDKIYNPFSRVTHPLAHKSWLFGWKQAQELKRWAKCRDEHRASICTSSSRGGSRYIRKCDRPKQA